MLPYKRKCCCSDVSGACWMYAAPWQMAPAGCVTVCSASGGVHGRPSVVSHPAADAAGQPDAGQLGTFHPTLVLTLQLTRLDSLTLDSSPAAKRQRTRHQHFWRNRCGATQEHISAMSSTAQICRRSGPWAAVCLLSIIPDTWWHMQRAPRV